MPRGSFLIEDILNNNSNSDKNNHHQPFKKRTFSQIEHETNDHENDKKSAKSFKHDDTSSGSSPQSVESSVIFQNYVNTNDLFLNSLLQNIQQQQQQHSQTDQQQQLLNNYYSLLISQQQQQQHHHQQDQFQNAFLMSKLFMPAKQQQQPVIKNSCEVKLVQKGRSNSSGNGVNTTTGQKASNSISSSPASSSSNELYNISSTNLSPQSNGDDNCSHSSCSINENNVSPLDALLQLANSTFIHKTSNYHQHDDNNITTPSLIMVDQLAKIGNFNTSTVAEADLLNNDLLLVQQQQQQLEKQAKTSLNSSFESNSAILLNTHQNNTSNNKRKRKNRTAFTANQIFELEKRFSNQRYLSPHDRDRIAYELALSTAQVITWFQNRRAKQKRDIEEMKNDVVAAKNSKVLDPDLDVDKVLRIDRFNTTKYNDDHDNSDRSRNSINQDDFNNNDNDYDEVDENEEDNHDDNDSINNFDSNSNLTDNHNNSIMSNK